MTTLQITEKLEQELTQSLRSFSPKKKMYFEECEKYNPVTKVKERSFYFYKKETQTRASYRVFFEQHPEFTPDKLALVITEWFAKHSIDAEWLCPGGVRELDW